MNNVIFENVPLAPLVSPYTDFAVVGTIVDLRFDQTVFGAEGFNVKGSLHVQNGAIAAALFHRCVDNFDLTVRPAEILDAPVPMIPFTECAIRFHLQPHGIDFREDEQWFKTFMLYQEGDRKVTVHFPERRQTVSYHEFMSVFAPDSAPTVPLTPGLQSVLPFVPL